MKHFFSIAMVVTLLFVPATLVAQTEDVPEPEIVPLVGSQVRNGADPNVTQLINPIGGKDGTAKEKSGVTNINLLVGKLIKAALGILGSVTLIVFMYGGFLWLTSRGSSEKIKEGLDAMLYAGVGIFIIFSSYAILDTILNGLK
ncbi:MAG: hypothetical protein KBC17_03105 [Candidatus Pacebacteria bacterium]|nr:hypothetical protein [Candidatus Paceibacterota bacterium]